MQLRQKKLFQEKLREASNLLDNVSLPLEKELILNKVWDRISFIISGMAVTLRWLIEYIEVDIQNQMIENKLLEIPPPRLDEEDNE